MSIIFKRIHFITIDLIFLLIPMVSSLLSSESPISIQIFENLPVGSVICKLSNVIIPRPSDTTKFKLIKNRFFQIENGDNLKVSGLIDRDDNLELCAYRNVNFSCIWRGILFCGTNNLKILEIQILDENDNVPQWSQNSIVIEVVENTKLDSFYLELPKARDSDEHPNNISYYKIEPTSKYFFISSEKSNKGIKPFLKLRRGIDRELISWHNVTLLAVDGGTPSKTGSLQLLIKIIDVNDNKPIFESSFYTQSIDCNLEINSTLDLKIHATDLDINANVTYRFSLNVPFIVQDCFDLNPFNAILRVKKSLKHECFASEYRFSIDALDHGRPVEKSKTTVTLHLKNQNLYPPSILLPGNNAVIRIIENQDIGVVILTGVVKDNDSGMDGKFNCSILEPKNYDIILTMNKTKSENIAIISLITNKIFDREVKTRIQLIIFCKDFGKPAFNTSAEISIIIIDVNDNSPQFEKEFYHYTIFEENQPNFTIAQLTAHDLDDGLNAQLRYRIQWDTSLYDPNKLIKVESNCQIIAIQSLDREKYPNGFRFVVIATDSGEPQRSGSTTVSIELMDINDNIPVFQQAFYNISFLEDFGSKKNSRKVAVFIAHDPDFGVNGDVTYSIVRETLLPFKLNPNSGELYSYDLVDRETQPSQYTFSITARDSPTNLLYRKTATVSVSIVIEDCNDNEPIFIFPNESNYKIQLSYLVPVGSLVTLVKAIDKDSGINSQIQFILEEEKRNILFSINETSGELLTSTVLSVIHKGEETLFIKAIDCGSPRLTAIQQLTIEIGEFRNPDSTPFNETEESFLSDQATFIIVGIILGTFFICCGLVTGICTMAYRRWHSSNNRSPPNQLYQAGEELTNLQYIDNYLIMKEMS